MSYHRISKKTASAVVPNLRHYDEYRANFSWDHVRASLNGLPDGKGLNIAYEAVDRHANTPRGNHTAIRWLDKQGHTHDYSYAELKKRTNQFANALQSLGIGKSDRVFVPAPGGPKQRPGHFYQYPMPCSLWVLVKVTGSLFWPPGCRNSISRRWVL